MNAVGRELRQAFRADIPSMHRIRLAVRENRLVSSVIDEADYIPEIETTGRGWVITEHNAVVAFAIGNRDTRSIWALFVDPAHEGKGCGRKLHDAMVEWLFSEGMPCIWLSTEPGTRAQRFYETAGWKFCRVLPSGERLYELRPNASGAGEIRIHQLIDEIRRYLVANPHACDTLEGVNLWVSRRGSSAEEVAAALDQLVKSGEIERIDRASTTFYRARP